MIRECKLKTIEVCKYTKHKLALVYFVFTLIIGAIAGLSAVGVGAIAGLLLTGPLTLGFINVIRLNYHGKEFSCNTLFTGFGDFGKTFLVAFLSELYIGLWTMLFIIPGIVKSYSYSMVYFIHSERHDLSANDCITESREIMDGHKWELFCLDLSYIGWGILCLLTLGILSFWVVPKITTAHYAFYRKITYKEE